MNNSRNTKNHQGIHPWQGKTHAGWFEKRYFQGEMLHLFVN
jgi:hypothetical protein